MNTDYERAIQAYQFQVERYQTWMNYYSIFNGALFVAIYSMYDYGCMNWLSQSFLVIISFLGLIASLCWLGVMIGNRCWMDSWMQHIKVEEKNNKQASSPNQKYSSLYYKDGTKLKGFLSTQKLTQIFIACVCLAWVMHCICIACFIEYQPIRYSLIAAVVVILILAYVLYACKCRFISSNIKNMKYKAYIFILALALSGCGNSSSNDNGESANDENVEDSVDKIESGDTSFTKTERLADAISVSLIDGSVLSEMTDNELKTERYIEWVRSGHFFSSDKKCTGRGILFIKSKLKSITPIENGNGCILRTSDDFIRELIFYTMIHEDLYSLSRNDYVYLAAIPWSVSGHNIVFDVAVASSSIYGLSERFCKIMNIIEETASSTSDLEVGLSMKCAARELLPCFDVYSERNGITPMHCAEMWIRNFIIPEQ